MKRFRQAAVSYARKRARTLATAVGKRIVRSVKKRVSRRMSKMQSKSITAFRALGGKLKMGNNIRSMAFVPSAQSNQVNVFEVTNIAQGNTNTTRESNNIFLKGFAYDFMFRNISKEKQYLNFACVTPKSFGGVLIDDSFFRNNNVETNIEFSNSELTSLAKYDRAINSDKYIIHFRKKSILGGAEIEVNSGFDTNSNNCKHYKGYKSIKSRISYSTAEAGDSEEANFKIYLIWWFTVMNEAPPLTADGLMSWDRDIQVQFNGE